MLKSSTLCLTCNPTLWDTTWCLSYLLSKILKSALSLASSLFKIYLYKAMLSASSLSALQNPVSSTQWQDSGSLSFSDLGIQQHRRVSLWSRALSLLLSKKSPRLLMFCLFCGSKKYAAAKKCPGLSPVHISSRRWECVASLSAQNQLAWMSCVMLWWSGSGTLSHSNTKEKEKNPMSAVSSPGQISLFQAFQNLEKLDRCWYSSLKSSTSTLWKLPRIAPISYVWVFLCSASLIKVSLQMD
jgi:hypothetical protein